MVIVDIARSLITDSNPPDDDDGDDDDDDDDACNINEDDIEDEDVVLEELGNDDEESWEGSDEEEQYSGDEEEGVEDDGDGDNECFKPFTSLQTWTSLQDLERETAGCAFFLRSFHPNRTCTQILVKVCPFVIQYM